MSYVLDGKAVSQEVFMRHVLGDRLVDLMIEGGYAAIQSGDVVIEMGAKSLRWAKGARGLKWELDRICVPASGRAEPLHLTAPSFDDSPAFVHGRVNVHGEDDRTRVREGYRAAYEEIRTEFGRKDGSRIAPSMIGGLRSMRDTIQEELDHRAIRAARYTNRIPQYLIVPFCETGRGESAIPMGKRTFDH